MKKLFWTQIWADYQDYKKDLLKWSRDLTAGVKLLMLFSQRLGLSAFICENLRPKF